MMEAGFYAYMIILATTYIRISKRDELSFKILGFCVALFATFVKSTFAIFIFPLLMLTIRHKKWFVNLAISLIGTAVVLAASVAVFHMVSSPFWSSHYAFEYSLLLRTEFFRTILRTIKNAAVNFFALLSFGIQIGSVWDVFISILLYSAILLLIYSCIVEIICYIKTKTFESSNKDMLLMGSCCLAVIGIMALFTGVMSINFATTRNCLPVFFFAVVIISGLKIRSKANFIGTFSVIFCISFFLGLGDYWGSHREYASTEYLAHVKQVEFFYTYTVSISKEDSRWENTVASYFGTPDIYWLNAPAGTGWNLYQPWIYSHKEKYVLLPVDFDEQIDYYKDKEYKMIGFNKEVILFRNPLYD